MTDGHDGGKHGISWSGSGEPTPPTETQALALEIGNEMIANLRGNVGEEKKRRELVAAPTERVETSPELMPCPFCGAKATFYKRGDGAEAVICTNYMCDVSISGSPAHPSIPKWNKRAAVAPSPAGESQEDSNV